MIILTFNKKKKKIAKILKVIVANELRYLFIFVVVVKIDPFPVIESLKTNKSELQLSKRVLKLQNENKSLKEKLSTCALNNESMQQKMAADKELILRLSEDVTKATTHNLDLTSKLKISEGEIESYKKLLVQYQSELSEMKNKHINEVS